MACFIVPLTQAIATTVVRKRLFKQSNNNTITQSSNPLMHHLPALEKMLWGGSLMLVVDHVINGELSLQFPFFTTLESAGGFQIMLREMLTVGVPMSLVLTAAWAVWAILKERRKVNVIE